MAAMHVIYANAAINFIANCIATNHGLASVVRGYKVLGLKHP